MTTSRRPLAVAAALAAAALVALLFLLADRRGEPEAPSAGAPASAARGGDGAAAQVPSRLPITLPAPAPSAPDGLPASFEGRVVSRATGAGVPGAELTFSRAGGASSVRAGPDGAFRFEPPAEGRWLLAAVTAPGFLPFAPEWGHSPVQLDARAGVHVRGLAVHLAPALELLGRVVDPEGNPAPGAEVRLLGVAREAALVSIPDRFTAGPDGAFRFSAPEGAVVEARQPGFAPGRAAVDVEAALERRLVVTLGPPHAAFPASQRIAGRVVARDSGAPVPGALVAAERGRGLAAAQATTGADGAFALEDLDPGPYRVTARAEGRAPASVRVAGGAVDVLLALGEGGRLRGCVRDGASGAPVAPFTVLVLERRSPLFRVPQRSRSFVDGSGCYVVEDLAPGPAAVVVSAPGYGPSDELAVEVTAGGEALADVVLERGGRLTGVVRDAETRAPLAGARLSVEGLRAEAASTFPVLAEGTSDAEGRFALDGLPPRLSLAAAAPGHHARIVGVDVPPGGSTGPIEVTLRPLAPGEQRRTDLAGIGVEIAPRGDGLAVTEVGEASGAAEAGIALGDVIVRVEGRPVRELGMAGAVNAIRGTEGTFVLLTVRRGDATLELRVARRLVRG